MSSLSVHSAAQKNQLSLIRTLVSEDPKLVDAVDADQRTPLHWAASTGSLDVARYLLLQGAQVDKPDGSGWTALHIAGADIKKTNDKGLTPLRSRRRCKRDMTGCSLCFGVQEVLQINVKDRANQTPLHRAATTGSTGLIKVLLNPPEGSPKTRLNTGDRIGNTPLHLAMESAHAEAAVLLIEAGADRGRVNLEDQIPEQVDGVGGQEQKRVRQYVVERCGPCDP
ncbi:ankyrin [Neolentinus lepideus HHB14362 ss-1]|uniref:Ankyrin n=1 Tax=Neolentinus lepideus HHB14362 ss-1 TaxID=1314782 RepID=A0A165P415_9AGAM|nr:ankyrin [Neolentinus lepideus HHB14362 ss-1]